MIQKAFHDCDSCIFFCTDNGYAPVTGAAVGSLIENSAPNRKYDILIFHSGIEDAYIPALEGLKGSRPNVAVRVVDLSSMLDERKFYVENRETITEEAYYRLFAPWILEEGYKKALYLDGDMIITADIMRLLDTEIGDGIIAAVRDYWGICNCYIPGDDRRNYRISIGLDNIDDYVISATLLFDLKRYRKSFTLQEVLNLAASRPWLQHDQDVINIMCRGRITFLSPEWGMIADYGFNHYLPQSLQDDLNCVKKPVIVHYGGDRKPWKLSFIPEEALFWQYAAKTPFFSQLLDRITVPEYRAYVLRSLFGEKPEIIVQNGSSVIYYNGFSAGGTDDGFVIINSVKALNGRLIMEGTEVLTAVPFDYAFETVLSVSGERSASVRQWDQNVRFSSIGKDIYRAKCFAAELPLPKSSALGISVLAGTDTGISKPLPVYFRKKTEPENTFRSQYFIEDGVCFTLEDEKITFVHRSAFRKAKYEMAFLAELWRVNQRGGRKAIVARLLAMLLAPFFVRPVWLISDGRLQAGGNGEAFFRFLQTKKKEVNSYFVISKESEDYSRLGKIGKVIPLRSFQHKIMRMLADCVIFSQQNEVFRNPFMKFSPPYRDFLCRAQCVFLQAGRSNAQPENGFSGEISDPVIPISLSWTSDGTADRNSCQRAFEEIRAAERRR